MNIWADYYYVNEISKPFTVSLSKITEDHISYTIPSKVTINDTTYIVTGIGEYAFLNCKSLTSLTIPNTVTFIHPQAFIPTPDLSNIVIDSGNPVYTSFEGSIINTKTNTIVRGTNNTIIPEGITSIGDYAFYGCLNLTSITIPNSVTSIGFGAFDNSGIFNNPSNWDNGVLYIGNNLITSKDLSYCIIKQGTRLIADGAFSSSSSSVSVVSIVEDYYYDYDYLSRSYLKKFYSYYLDENYILEYYDIRSLAVVEIPNSVKYIGNMAFADCHSLYKVELGDSIESIGNEAFINCGSLSSIILPKTLKTIGSGCFAGCISLKNITIPSSVKEIPIGAFLACKNLKNVIIENGVQSIYNGAFWCPSLKSIKLPNSIVSIERYAFADDLKIVFDNKK